MFDLWRVAQQSADSSVGLPLRRRWWLAVKAQHDWIAAGRFGWLVLPHTINLVWKEHR